MNARTFNPDGCYVFPRAGKSVALPPIYYDFDTTDSGREAQNWPIKHFFRCWPGRDSGAGRNSRRLSVSWRNKGKLWTHFSFYEVWDNISDEEIAELEGLFRHLYRFDSRANSLNRQKGYKKLRILRQRTEKEWL